MLNLLIAKILQRKNKNVKEICGNCVWWKSEQDFNLPEKKYKGFCSACGKYTFEYNKCKNFKEELFEATENSTSTPEYSLDLNLEIEKNKIEGNNNGTGNEQR